MATDVSYTPPQARGKINLNFLREIVQLKFVISKRKGNILTIPPLKKTKYENPVNPRFGLSNVAYLKHRTDRRRKVVNAHTFVVLGNSGVQIQTKVSSLLLRCVTDEHTT